MTAPRFAYFPIEMDLSTSIIREAYAPCEWKNLAAKIIVFSIVAFLLITAFEALLINGFKLLANGGISLLNAVFTLCPQQPPPPEIPAPPAELVLSVVETHPREDIEMPEALPEAKKKIAYVVENVSTKNGLTLWGMEDELNGIRKELENKYRVHPFQFLEAIYGRGSKVAKYMPDIVDSILKFPRFMEGVVSGFNDEEHKKKVWDYAPSFAKKVNISLRRLFSLLHPVPDLPTLVRELTETNKT
jgi:hypothetical protein